MEKTGLIYILAAFHRHIRIEHWVKNERQTQKSTKIPWLLIKTSPNQSLSLYSYPSGEKEEHLLPKGGQNLIGFS